MSTNNVAQIILDQLGGGRFITMTGAKDFRGTPDSLRFRVPANMTKGRGTHFVVLLEPNDTYKVSLIKYPPMALLGADFTELQTMSGIQADQLRDVFTQMTGLRTSL